MTIIILLYPAMTQCEQCVLIITQHQQPCKPAAFWFIPTGALGAYHLNAIGRAGSYVSDSAQAQAAWRMSWGSGSSWKTAATPMWSPTIRRERIRNSRRNSPMLMWYVLCSSPDHKFWCSLWALCFRICVNMPSLVMLCWHLQFLKRCHHGNCISCPKYAVLHRPSRCTPQW